MMYDIVWGMRNLHRRKILHRDLKASNILIHNSSTRHDPSRTDSASEFRCVVADFECSVGVVGTRFWRAPKILLALQNGNITSNTFTEMADVYSYAMTWYKVLMGRIPFQSHPISDYSVVLSGDRLELPDYVNPGSMLASGSFEKAYLRNYSRLYTGPIPILVF
jgi:serine/threonine protein kinase